MVSFQCEGCGDVLTKKKLDAHRNQCRSASFSCLDCMTHFHGTDYRSHTSCISEDQKYQGALYKEKPSKNGKKSVRISETGQQQPRKAYVEDAPDADTGNAIIVVDVPPEAPAPPPAPSSEAQPSVNVFDFLVANETPNASKTSLVEVKENKAMADYTPSVAGSDTSYTRERKGASRPRHDPEYESRGYSYGSEPFVPTTQKRERPKVEYFTPAPKEYAKDLIKELESHEHHDHATSKHSTDKKRKRHERDESKMRSHESEDAIMTDVPPPPPPSYSTGLTGGLDRLLSKTTEYHDDKRRDLVDSTPSIHKYSKPTQSYIVKERGRDNPPSTIISSAVVKMKPRRESDESRPRKHHRSQRDESHQSDSQPRHRHRSKSRTVKAIEYPRDEDEESNTRGQMVVYRNRAELFMSFVTKGPESEQGYSMNKALKRYHRERGEKGGGEKAEEEKELWKGLRLKRNERGEVVVFF